MTTTVGIVGAGLSGLTLALRLQQLGVDTTVYAEQTADGMRRSQLPNTAARWAHTLEREEQLGIDHSAYAGRDLGCFHFFAPGDPPLAFRGDLADGAQAVDFRVLLPQMLELFESRGGAVVVTGNAASADDIVAWSPRHDVVVVGVGRRSMGELFPPDPARSPYRAPQRTLFAGLFRGIAAPEPFGIGLCISPGRGEIFQLPIWTKDGPAQGILVEAHPGSPLEELSVGRSYPDDPAGFVASVRRLLADHAAPIAERIEPSTFGLLGPRDILQGALTPVVRRAWATLPDGGLAVAVGDAWITNDPLTGQGANLGSRSGWIAAEAIASGGPFDETFGRRLEAEMWRFAEPVTAWSNAFLGLMPDHVFLLFVAAAQNQAVADAVFSMFNQPDRMWAVMSDPGRAAAFAAGAISDPA